MQAPGSRAVAGVAAGGGASSRARQGMAPASQGCSTTVGWMGRLAVMGSLLLQLGSETSCISTRAPSLLASLNYADPFVDFEEVQVLAADEAGRRALEAAGTAQAVGS